jgi:low affinity Fe/Cu permease
VLIQGYRDTAAIHAKLDEIIVSLNRAHNEVVGLEHEDTTVIIDTVRKVEARAERRGTPPGD